MAGLRGIPSGLIAGAVGLGALTPLLLAGSAAAVGTAEWTLSCDKVSIRVAGYSPEYTNRITLTVGGRTLVDKQQFGASFSQDFAVPAHSEDLPATLTVITDEQPKSPVTKTGTVTPCPSPSPTPTPSVTPTPTPTATATPTASPSPSKSPSRKPSPKPTTPQLADTGGGDQAGTIAAAGAGALVIGGGLVLLTRRRSQN